MEEKKGVKIGLSTVLLILAVIVIIIMGYFMYKIYNEKTVATDKVTELNNQVNTLESTVSDLEGKISGISDIVNNTSSNVTYTEITQNLEGIDVLYVTNAINNNDGTYTLKGVIYTQYTISANELNNIVEEGTFQIDGETYSVKNSSNANEYDLYRDNDEYALYSIRQKDSDTYYLETNAQIQDNWKLTNEYKEITVDADTVCDNSYYDGVSNSTVEEVFKDFTDATAYETRLPDGERTFTFEFENGKCVKVIDYLTSI